MKKESKIYVAGHRGMVGSAVVNKLKQEGYENISCKTHAELDLTDQIMVREFFLKEKPEYVFFCAAKVGGIYANEVYPAEFIYQNLMIQNNIIHEAYKNNVKKLLFLGSSCIYPKYAKQPIKETELLSGKLESTNDAYAIAKIAGIKMCQAYAKEYGMNNVCLMPTNLYGPNDNYDLQSSHVLPALIRKFHEAKTINSSYVEIWGTGKPRREFLYVEDLAEAMLFLMKNYNDSEIINIGVGEDISINDLALLIKKVIKFGGGIKFDNKKPDGTPRKLLDVSKINGLGWMSSISIEEGIARTYEKYKEEH